MRIIVLLFALLALVPQVHAVKYRTYTLAELTKKADVIVVAKVTVSEGIAHAKLLRSLKGSPGTDIVVDSFAIRDEEKAQFINGETVILFLQKEENGRRMLLGYGNQGKWPKTTGKWPYSDVHVVPLQRVEKAVGTLLELDKTKNADDKTSKLRSLLSSTEGFDQSCAFEYLDAGCDQKVRNAIRSDVDAVRRTLKDKYLQAIGDSASRTNIPKHNP